MEMPPTPRPPAIGRTCPSTIVRSRGGTLQPRRGETEKHLARRRGRLTNGRTSACQPCAPTRAAGVRTSRRVAIDYGYPRGIDAELLGSHLRYRDTHAGADIHFARVDRDRAIRIDRERSCRLPWDRAFDRRRRADQRACSPNAGSPLKVKPTTSPLAVFSQSRRFISSAIAADRGVSVTRTAGYQEAGGSENRTDKMAGSTLFKSCSPLRPPSPQRIFR